MPKGQIVLSSLFQAEDFMSLRKRALGLSLGVVWGLAVFVVTILSTIRGMGHSFVNINAYFLGYQVSYLGAFIGLAWGFVYGFVGGVLIAWLYDLFCKLLYKSESPAR
jgi:hypothetical protein